MGAKKFFQPCQIQFLARPDLARLALQIQHGRLRRGALLRRILREGSALVGKPFQ